MLYLGIFLAVLGFVLYVYVGPNLNEHRLLYLAHRSASNLEEMSPQGKKACRIIAGQEKYGYLLYYPVRGLGLFFSASGGVLLSKVLSLNIFVPLGLLALLLIVIVYFVFIAPK